LTDCSGCREPDGEPLRKDHWKGHPVRWLLCAERGRALLYARSGPVWFLDKARGRRGGRQTTRIWC